MQQPLNIKHTGDTTSQTAAVGRNVQKPGDNEGNYQMIAAALMFRDLMSPKHAFTKGDVSYERKHYRCLLIVGH